MGAHSVFLQCCSDQPTTFGAAEVIAADVETLDMWGMTDDVGNVSGIVGCDGVVTDVDIGHVGMCDNGGGCPFQASLVDALK